MTDEERDAWAEEVLDKIRLYRRRDVSGLRSMLDEDLADVLDVLTVAPLLLDEQLQSKEMGDYERRRLAWLERYEVRDIDGNGEVLARPRPASPPDIGKSAH